MLKIYFTKVSGVLFNLIIKCKSSKKKTDFKNLVLCKELHASETLFCLTYLFIKEALH